MHNFSKIHSLAYTTAMPAAAKPGPARTAENIAASAYHPQ
jgi:hypothetical protein